MTYTALFTELLLAEIELWDSLDRRLNADVGVTLPTFQALSAINRLASPVRVQDISDGMSITVGATSKLVDRLERRELLRRESNPGDRRSSSIVLTVAGRKALGAAAALAEQHLHALLSAAYPEARANSLTSELASLRAVVRDGASE